MNSVNVTPKMIFQMIASRKNFWTNDAVCRFFAFENFRMIFPDVCDAIGETFTLGKADVTAEHGVGGPVLLRCKFVGGNFKSEKEMI